MQKIVLLILTVIGFLAAPVWAENAIRKETVQFAKGSTQATIQARIKGDADVDYLVRAKAGQTMTVTLKTSNRMNYFNVLPPDTGEALFVGQDGSGHFEGVLPKDGEYTIRVYLMRAAARRNESAQYTLTVKVDDSAPDDKTEATAPASVSFDETLSLQGIAFHVTSANAAHGNVVKITPAGLAIDNSPIKQEIDGVVTGAEVADINADGSPEIYVYVTAPGAGKRMSLVAYSANKKKSLSQIDLPALEDDAKNAKGYRGQDEFAVVEGIIARRFPLFPEDRSKTEPTGKMRQIQYKLVAGEASWMLRIDQVVEF
jgi:hypothetical protein